MNKNGAGRAVQFAQITGHAVLGIDHLSERPGHTDDIQRAALDTAPAAGAAASAAGYATAKTAASAAGYTAAKAAASAATAGYAAAAGTGTGKEKSFSKL